MALRTLVLVAFILLGSALAAPPAAAETLRLTSLAAAEASEQATVDLGAPGPSAGDMVVWHGPVVDEAGAELGTSTGRCVRVSAREDRRSCSWTIELADGSLSVAGVQRPGAVSSVLALVGGTGAYEGATGRLTLTPAEDFSEFVYAIDYRE